MKIVAGMNVLNLLAGILASFNIVVPFSPSRSRFGEAGHNIDERCDGWGKNIFIIPTKP